MQSFSDVWKDSRSRHVASRIAEYRVHLLTIAEKYIPADRWEEYQHEVEDEKKRLKEVYEWSDAQDRIMEDHLIFGDPIPKEWSGWWVAEQRTKPVSNP